MFTWSCNTPFIARRLDYFFISNDLIPFCLNSDIKKLGFSDHKAITVLLDFSTFKRGPSTYKFDTKILQNQQFVAEIKDEISRIKLLNMSPHKNGSILKSKLRQSAKFTVSPSPLILIFINKKFHMKLKSWKI